MPLCPLLSRGGHSLIVLWCHERSGASFCHRSSEARTRFTEYCRTLASFAKRFETPTGGINGQGMRRVPPFAVFFADPGDTRTAAFGGS
jgi:hypothetical protein